MKNISFNSIFLILAMFTTTSLTAQSVVTQAGQMTQEQLLKRMEIMEQELVQLKKGTISVANPFGSNQYGQMFLHSMTATKDGVKFIVDKIDKIVSKKAFITALVVCGPTFAIYCKLFDPALIKRLVQLFTRSGAKAAVSVGGAVSGGVLQGIASNPGDFVKISALLSLNNAIFYGVPFLLKAIVTFYLGGKV